MFPIAFAWGPLEIHWYGVLMALGFLAGAHVASRLGERWGLEPQRVMDVAFWALLGGLIGARVVYEVVNWRDLVDSCFAPQRVGLSEPHCFEVFKIWKGGLVWYGGLMGAIPLTAVLLKRWRMPVLPTIDAIIAGVALGHGIGRLGCFTAGCCFGYPTDAPQAFAFPNGSSPFNQHTSAFADAMAKAGGWSLPIHPTQFYEAGGEALIFLLLMLMVRYKRFHGQVLMAYLGLYAILRAITETFRGDHERGYLWSWPRTVVINGVELVDQTGVSTSQLISALFGVIVITWLVVRLARLARAEAPGAG